MTKVVKKKKSSLKARFLRRAGLPIVMLMLVSSIALRFGETAWSAFANTSENVGHEPAAESDNACLTDQGVEEMIAALNAREAAIVEKEAMQAKRAKTIELAEKRLEERLKSLVAAEEKLSATLTLADKAADEDVARLVTLYESMKPKDAAALFEEMDPEFSAGFMARMRPDAAAAVMAALTPQRAYSISVLMAGRNANAPKE